MKELRWLPFGLLSLALSTIALGYGWVAYGWHHDENRQLPPEVMASIQHKLVAVSLDVLAAPSGTKTGDRLDILASAEQKPVPLVLDALVLANNVRGCFCLMELTDSRIVSQAIRNGSKITCRLSVVPGTWQALQRDDTANNALHPRQSR